MRHLGTCLSSTLVMLGGWLDLIILKVFSNLSDFTTHLRFANFFYNTGKKKERITYSRSRKLLIHYPTATSHKDLESAKLIHLTLRILNRWHFF